ncbi:alkyl hydroperoxide reductase [Bacillus coahuilensis p1.1.43]|uniref:thioredoxin-dependent peroxiredoxin n=1 Tax=Bacillus coahuilensis p1.1.43 TaxID=1150625 RepID=A0A147KB71_9BACI|nr:peroxiredoxin-like family protein [Bacillus coahuilensis]KUP08208.1 alkyl hydroperoxide reductase [Bacillus coahuilensis p1.1.43]
MTSLREQFDENIRAFSERAPKEVVEQMQTAIDELEASNAGKGLRIGEKAPNFTLPNAKGESVTLYEVLEKGPVILTFYRGGWCPYCNMELRAYQEKLEEIHNAGTELIAISPQTPDESLTTAEKNELAYHVLSDEGNVVANDFNLVYSLPDYLVEIYKNFNLDLVKHNGNDEWSLPVAATFIIKEDGTIQFEYSKADYKDRVEPSEIVEKVKTL